MCGKCTDSSGRCHIAQRAWAARYLPVPRSPCKKISQDGGGGGWWQDIFGTQSAIDSCEAECPCGDNESWAICDECVAECQNRKSQAGQYIESEGGLFSFLDKLGGTLGKFKGWGGTGSNVAGPWQPRPEEDKNEKLIWGAIILIFLIGIIAFVYFMGRKKK